MINEAMIAEAVRKAIAEINTDDADSAGIKNGDKAKIIRK